MDLDLRDGDGWTPLMRACFWTYPKVARALLERGADLELQTPEGGTALMFACLHGPNSPPPPPPGSPPGAAPRPYKPLKKRAAQVVALLLERGARTDVENSQGYTALMMARQAADDDIVRLVMQKGVLKRE